MRPFFEAKRALEAALETDHITHADLAWALGTTAKWIHRLTQAEAKDVRPAWALALRYMAREQLTCDEAARLKPTSEAMRERVEALPMTRSEVAKHLGVARQTLRGLQRSQPRRHYFLATEELCARFADVQHHVATYTSHNLASML